MTTLSNLFPLNLEVEKKRFEADITYNPQFAYSQPIDPAYLTKWGKPQKEFVEIANQIVTRYTSTHPATLSEYVYDQIKIGNEVQKYFQTLLKIPVPPILFNQNQIARCQVTDAGISFRPHLKMSVADFEGLLRHEIGTHYLRRYNHQLHGFSTIINDDQGRTEEGVANLHTYLLHPQPLLFKSALRYQAAWLGQSLSFSEVYQKIKDQGVSHRETWRATLRTKRGLTDTSQPQSFTKDIMYLEGIIKVLRWLKTTTNHPFNFYQGQLSLNQLETLELVPQDKIIPPPFMKDLKTYHHQVDKLIRYNGIEKNL